MNLFDDLPAADRPGQAAAERCAAKAEDLAGWDRDAAAQFVLDYLGHYGPTSGEVLVTAASQLYRPHDGRAYGAVLGSLSRRRLIRRAGYTERRKGHGTAGGIVWELADV